MSQTKNSKKTYERLIESAGKLFAEKGFRDTTIREICKNACANQASVNYYFRDKDKLYDAVLIHAIDDIWERYPTVQAIKNIKSRTEKLKIFIRNFLLRRLSPEIPEWYALLIRRETIMANPKAEQVMRNKILENDEILYSIIKEFIGNQVNKQIIEFCASSIVGQIMHHCLPRGHLKHHFYREKITTQNIEEIVEHITGFSIAGLEKIKKTYMEQK